MMEDITLATHINKKLIFELFDENDHRRLHNHDYFITQILELLRKYPELRGKLIAENMTVNSIIEAITNLFKEEAKKRKLCVKTLRFIIKKNESQRKRETFLMLLIVGFSMGYIYRRMMNNLKRVGELKDEEWDDLEGVKNLVDLYPMPLIKQHKSPSIEHLYSLIENSDATMPMLTTLIDKVAYEQQFNLPTFDIENSNFNDSDTESKALTCRRNNSMKSAHSRIK